MISRRRYWLQSPNIIDEALAAPAAGLWFEVHAENYMVAGGPRLAMLEAIRRSARCRCMASACRSPATADPDPDHLAASQAARRPLPARARIGASRLVAPGRPLFPRSPAVPRTNEVLARCADNIGRVQDALGRQILIENPTHYLNLSEHSWSETSFLAELARRSGCGLLIDVNNVAVGAHNVGSSKTNRTRRAGNSTYCSFVLPYLPFLIVFGILPTGYAVYFAFTNAGGTFSGFDNFITTVRRTSASWTPWSSMPSCTWSFWLVLPGGVRRRPGAAPPPAREPAVSESRVPLLHPGRPRRRGRRRDLALHARPDVSPGSFLLATRWGSNTFAQSIAPGNLPYCSRSSRSGPARAAGSSSCTARSTPFRTSRGSRAHRRRRPWQTAWRLKIPMLRKWIVYMVILAFAGGTQLFVEPQIVQHASFGLVS